MCAISTLRAASVLLSLLSLSTSSPTKAINNLHLDIDIYLSPSKTLVAAAPTCTSEGFHANPDDCTKFFRCVDFRDGKLTLFNFDCGPGTVYDADLITCNYRWAVDRNSQCYSPLPNPPDMKSNYAVSDATRGARNGKQVALAADNKAMKIDGSPAFACTADGIFADPADCVTFHVCTKAVDGSFTHDVHVCAGTETFCPPVGGCGPPLACPASCSIGGLRGAALAQEDLR